MKCLFKSFYGILLVVPCTGMFTVYIEVGMTFLRNKISHPTELIKHFMEYKGNGPLSCSAKRDLYKR